LQGEKLRRTEKEATFLNQNLIPRWKGNPFIAKRGKFQEKSFFSEEKEDCKIVPKKDTKPSTTRTKRRDLKIALQGDTTSGLEACWNNFREGGKTLRRAAVEVNKAVEPKPARRHLRVRFGNKTLQEKPQKGPSTRSEKGVLASIA